jgi:hypothetical protein
MLSTQIGADVQAESGEHGTGTEFEILFVLERPS